MSYTKTTWVNNITPIDETNLNKIEQGIYDNSLVVDAVTNTLNPTDTETYKTAELTEGQITDVIGVSDIIIKGQTSQNGEPTPSSPVDVNVVSGSNVINTSGKNKIVLKNGKYTSNNITINVDNGIIKFSGTTGSSNSGFFIPLQNDVILKNEETNILSIKTVGTTNSQVATRLTKTESAANNNSFGRASVTAASNTTRTISYTQTERETYKYFYIQINANQTLNFELYSQLEQGSTATDYEPHQGKELPLDLGSIELCKIGNYQDYFYKSGSKWYLHKEIEKKVLNGSENWQLANSGISNYYYYYNLGHTTIQSSSIASTHYPYAFISNSNTEQGILVLADGNIRIRYGTEDTVANFKTWLATNNVSVYYPLATVTNTEITDTTLISQLEAIYNAPLYEETNITQTNNDLPMVLDITACKDNINGIKAFIRK